MLKKLELSEIPDKYKDLENAPSDIYSLLTRLIKEQTELNFLARHPLKILLLSKARYSKGRRTLGLAKLCTPVEKLLHPFHAIITLDYFFIQEYPERLEPLLYHELCHFLEDENGKLTMVGHDIEEFYSVIKHYGDWNKEINTIQQMQLNFELQKQNEHYEH
jgi:Putative phage metallopeptidase